MLQTVSITSQGQITLPVTLRRLLGLDKYRKVTVHAEGDRIIIKPVSDIMSLAGSLQNKALKNKKIDEVIQIEKKAVGEAVARKYSPKSK